MGFSSATGESDVCAMDGMVASIAAFTFELTLRPESIDDTSNGFGFGAGEPRVVPTTSRTAISTLKDNILCGRQFHNRLDEKMNEILIAG